MGRGRIIIGMAGALFYHGVFADIRVDTHAPIGVMGDHLHKQGEIMVSYRYMQMEMAGIVTDQITSLPKQ